MDWGHLSELVGVVGGIGIFFWKIIDKRFDKIDEKFKEINEEINNRFSKVDERFDQVIRNTDERFNKVDNKFDKIDERFNKVDSKFDGVDEKFDQIWNEIKEMKSDFQKEFKELKIDTFEIKERLSGLEAENIIYNIMPNDNKRSEAAKRIWQKRRGKRLLKNSPS